jgi:ABC-type nitrate/sulfonate/bicarbonate transport system permease component
MLGGTIATVTAVLVQQVVSRMETGDPWAVAVWLAPTIVINPLIFVWSRKVLTSNKTKLFS